ncbi:AAA family ATPase [Ensifer adhaerens]|uniref:AAA family ATPase n=1 Tax=Ensifer adhaerens TaxID=106592 RepID=UPI000DC3D33B|nr:AAA family ATPase [Ensifer adhaerens]RAS16136.1 AAA domain-containing protein [Ensifer adhaerens]
MAPIPKIVKRSEPGGSLQKLEAANDNRPIKILSSGELVRGFVPPDYFLDGVAQKGFIYSMTAATGTGKTAVLLLIAALAAQGGEFSGREIEKGRVVYFAGENPDDVTMRWIGMAHETGFDLDEMEVYFIRDRFSVPDALEAIREQVEALGGADLVVVDTSAAYFHGTDENGNTELGKHARDLRALTTLPGRPCVMVACHPTKNAGQDNLLPRGGGAFIAEVDGNLTLAKSDGIIRMHWQGKHRGPDFDPLTIELKTITAPALVDSKGRPIPTVMAQALSTGEARSLAASSRRDEDDALMQIERDSKASLSAIAENLHWRREDGAVHKDRARRATDKLKRDKLVTYEGRKWKITPAGFDTLTDIRAERHREQNAAQFAARIVEKSIVRGPVYSPHDNDDD